MASSPSTSLRLELMSPGDKANTWGTITNTNLGSLLEQAICGYIDINLTSNATKTLTPSNYALDEARSAVLNITGVITATVSIIAPTAPKIYIIRNSTTGGQSIVIKTLSGAGVTIANGKMSIVFCNGSGFEELIPKLADNATTAVNLSGSQTNYATLGRVNSVANMLGWKNFGDGHVIFDASAGTAPNGDTVNNTNATTVWVATYPTLMGWNGISTYGVRVDSARLADNGRYIYQNGQYGGAVGYIEPSALHNYYSLYSGTAGAANTAAACTGNAASATTATNTAGGTIYGTLVSTGGTIYAAGNIETEATMTAATVYATGESKTDSYFRSNRLVGTGVRSVTCTALGAIQAASDERLKTRVFEEPLPGLVEVLQLQPRAYKWNDDIENRGDDAAIEIGFFANETATIIPSSAPMGADSYYGFYDRPIIAALVKAVQELSAKVTALEAK